MIFSNKLLKTCKSYDKSKFLSRRPKGMKEADWKEYVADFKLNKLIVLGNAPKAPARKESRQQEDKE